MMKYFYLLLVLMPLLLGCGKDKYIQTRVAGTYEIVDARREIWDSLGNKTEEKIDSRYVFYLRAAENAGFGEGLCNMDSAGVEPGFLAPLELSQFPGASAFSMRWSAGPNDNDRLSFVKEDASGIGENSSLIMIQRGTLGGIESWGYFTKTGSLSFVYEEYTVKRR